MIFEFRGPGAPKGLQAATVGGELQRIYQQRGQLTPSVIVDEAREPTAILHSAFEWDDVLAGEQYRQTQARQIVRSVVLVPQPERGEMAPILRAFVSLSVPDAPQQRHYKPTIEVLENPAEAEEVQRRLRHELLNLRRRYLDLIDAESMLRVVREVLVA